MNSTERFYRIDRLLADRGVVAARDLQAALEVSRATLKRDIAFMRERLHAPIVFDRDAGGYRYERYERYEKSEKAQIGPRYQMPGLWFSSEEITALMTMQQLLEELDAGGLLARHVRPLMDRLGKALGSEEAPAREVRKRVRLMRAQARRAPLQWFEIVGRALMSRRRLLIDYFTRSRADRSSREVSPQRLVHYRGNWYLDAWCHRSEALRMFALDAIGSAQLLDTRARELPLKQVEADAAAAYGIFRGGPVQWATLVFSAEAARWVRAETWHADQRGRDLADGRYELEVPYADPRELEMDVLRHAENVEVVAPAALRAQIRRRLEAARAHYD